MTRTSAASSNESSSDFNPFSAESDRCIVLQMPEDKLSLNTSFVGSPLPKLLPLNN